MVYELSPTTADEQVPNDVHLRNELRSAREETANAIAKLDGYRRAVRRTVIDNIKNGTICRTGANEALESWGDEPYRPTYTVRMTVDVEMTISANDEDDARDEAYSAINVETGEYDNYLYQTSITDVSEVDGD